VEEKNRNGEHMRIVITHGVIDSWLKPLREQIAGESPE
jgi:hypothetical protein